MHLRCRICFLTDVRIFLKGEAKNNYLELQRRKDKEADTILKSFERVKKILKENPQYGQPIKKKLIPKSYVRQGITNLYRVELAKFWRLIYTIKGNEIEIYLFVLLLSDHKSYDKLFGYKKK